MPSQYLSVPTPSQRHKRPPSPPPTPRTLEPTYRNLTRNVQAFDFDRFFKEFDENSPILQFASDFKKADLQKLISQAFAPIPTHDPDSARWIMRSQRQLEDELRKLDQVMQIMEGARLSLADVRESFDWVRTMNLRMLSVHEVEYGRPDVAHTQPLFPNEPSRVSRSSTSPPWSESGGDSPPPPYYRSPSHHRSSSLSYGECYPSSPTRTSQGTSGHRSRNSMSALTTHRSASAAPASHGATLNVEKKGRRSWHAKNW